MEKINKTNYTLKIPWLLWTASVIHIFFSFYQVYRQPLREFDFAGSTVHYLASILSVIACVTVFQRSKGPWTISLFGWISSSMMLLTSGHLIMDDWIFVGLAAVNVAATLFYLRTP